MTGTITPQLATGHIGINVTDLDRSVAFYRAALGFEALAVHDEGEHRYAFLGTGGTLRLTLWQQSQGRFSPETPGLHHLSFEAAGIDEVRTVESALRALGTEFAYDGVVAHGEGVTSGGIFFTDPDGTRLEVYAPSGAPAASAPHGAAPTCGFF